MTSKEKNKSSYSGQITATESFIQLKFLSKFLIFNVQILITISSLAFSSQNPSLASVTTTYLPYCTCKLITRHHMSLLSVRYNNTICTILISSKQRNQPHQLSTYREPILYIIIKASAFQHCQTPSLSPR